MPHAPLFEVITMYVYQFDVSSSGNGRFHISFETKFSTHQETVIKLSI